MCTLMILCHGIDFVFTHFSHKTSIIMLQQVSDLHANFQAFQTSSFEIEVYIWKSIWVFFPFYQLQNGANRQKTFIQFPIQSLE